MHKEIVIAGTETQIWAINPETKTKIRLKPAKDKTRILDIQATNRGVYHASEIVEKIRDQNIHRLFDFNYIQIFNTLSHNPALTIMPPKSQSLPPNQRFMDLDFQFNTEYGGLHYSLNGWDGIVFPRISRVVGKRHSEDFSIDDNDVFYRAKKIATLDNSIVHFQIVKASIFSSQFRKSNKPMYQRNKPFFTH